MNTRILLGAVGAGTLAIVMAALPGFSESSQQRDESRQKVQRLENLNVVVQGDDEPGENREFNFSFDEQGGSWLGAEIQDVNTEKAKELKLPAERGVMIRKVVADSPASKSGLKENDVVTEINGQHVEGAVQFRRMIREIPAGRNARLTVWRDGRSQSVSVTLGNSEKLHREFRKAGPGNFTFRLPPIPEIAPMPEIPEIPEIAELPDFDNVFMYRNHPRLGIDAEDLSGQLGAFFGVPEGEGVLVRGVNEGSPAEKAGVKAGDVITSVDGDRVRSVGDLLGKLSGPSHETEKNKTGNNGKESGEKEQVEKGRTITLGVLRNKAQISLNAELPAPEHRNMRITTKRTHI